MNALECTRPVLISEKDLRHISCHHRKISTERRQCRCIAVNPADPCGCIFRFRDFKRCVGWVCTHDGTATLSEQDRQAACPATHIENTLRAQFASDGEVGGQIIAVTVKGVIDGCKARVRKNRIRHLVTICTFGHLGDSFPAPRALAGTCGPWLA